MRQSVAVVPSKVLAPVISDLHSAASSLGGTLKTIQASVGMQSLGYRVLFEFCCFKHACSRGSNSCVKPHYTLSLANAALVCALSPCIAALLYRTSCWRSQAKATSLLRPLREQQRLRRTLSHSSTNVNGTLSSQNCAFTQDIKSSLRTTSDSLIDLTAQVGTARTLTAKLLAHNPS